MEIAVFTQPSEGLISDRTARLTVRGRLLVVERLRVQGMPIAHAAKAMGVSRQCAHRWVKRFDAEGEPGLHDRSSRHQAVESLAEEMQQFVLWLTARHDPTGHHVRRLNAWCHKVL